MQVFISDLHMTDTGAGGAVSDAQLAAFADRLQQMADKNAKPIKLVLLGDIFDMLRSPLWAKLWQTKNGSAPWSAVSKNFKHLKNSPAENTAIQIANAISSRYTDFLAALAKLVSDGKVETVYVPGNHDYMVQHSQDLRQIMKKALVLQHDVSKPFKVTYSDKAAEVYATHGNSYDPVNYHRAVEGHWAMGDAVVLRIVNRFPDEVCTALGCSPEQEIGQLLQEIDNIEPLSDVPLYVRWLIDENLSLQNARNEVLKVWQQVVDDFLALKDFREAPYGAKAFQMVRLAFSLSKTTRFGDLITSLAKKFPEAGIDYRQAAREELGKNPGYRFLVFGHTHQPTLEPVKPAPNDQVAFYVNTGCWRRVVTRPRNKDLRLFAARRVASYFVIDDSAGTEPQERFHLFQEWHAS